VDKGTYKGHRVDFDKYAVSFFNPYLYPDSALIGCGASSLALLTGIAPGIIAAKNGGEHYPDEFMLRFLRHQRFRALQLTQCNVSNARDDIGIGHVVLISQLFTRNEATWGVIFHGMYYHNFRLYTLDTLSMLNKPILSAYVIFHPKWRLLPLSGREKSAPKPAPKSRRLTLKALGSILQRKSLNPRCLVGKGSGV
jgi:hypothetical protein